MDLKELSLPGVMLIERPVHCDCRGWFTETWTGDGEWSQDNASFSVAGVLRGLHLQTVNPQAKLVSVLQGKVFDVALDVRSGRWVGEYLVPGRQLLVPAGYAHGFYAVADSVVSYKCSAMRDAASETVVRWDSAGIDWPCRSPLLSERDASAVPLARLVSVKRSPLHSSELTVTGGESLPAEL